MNALGITIDHVGAAALGCPAERSPASLALGSDSRTSKY